MMERDIKNLTLNVPIYFPVYFLESNKVLTTRFLLTIYILLHLGAYISSFCRFFVYLNINLIFEFIDTTFNVICVRSFYDRAFLMNSRP